MRCAPIPAMPIVLVTPAFPETGRTVYQGNLFVGSVPLNESPLKDHPLNPMHDSNLVRVLARQSQDQGRACRSRDMARGADAVRARLADLAQEVSAPPLPTPCSNAIWKRSGTVALEHRVSVGASGHRARPRPRPGGIGPGQIECAERDVGCAGGRAGGVSCRQLFASDAAADRKRRGSNAGAASRSGSGGRGQG